MKKSSINFLLFSILTFLFLITIYSYRHKIKSRLKYFLGYYSSNNSSFTKCTGCSELFNDNIKVHEKAYRNNSGIIPQIDDNGLNKLLKKNVLVKVTSNEKYIVKKSDYSQPFVLPKCSNFINELALRYFNKCEKCQLSYTPFLISNMTRTKRNVRDLMKINGNAIENSAHLKGKTFDVNYLAFKSDSSQLNCFISALKELKMNNKCYVKHENNGCLHITVN